jgi:hypothetical protein
MNRRLTRLLLRLYPRAYRDRYGAEVVRLTEELIAAGEITPAEGALNLAVAAGAERGRALAGSWRTAAAMALAGLVAVAGSFFTAGHVRHAAPASAAPARVSLARVLCVFGGPTADGVTVVVHLLPAGPAFRLNLPAGTKVITRSPLQISVTFARPGKGVGRACVLPPGPCWTGAGRTVKLAPGLSAVQVTVNPGRCVVTSPDKAAHSGP